MKSSVAIILFMLFAFLSMYRNVKKKLDDGSRAPRRRVGAEAAAGEEPDSGGGASQGVDDLGEPYFSYEYEETPKRKTPKSSTKPQPAPARMQPQPAVAVETPARQFDLRQAVIYQTVLNNPYVSEINQSIQ